MRDDLVESAPPRAWNPLGAVLQFVDRTATVAEIELRKVRHDPTEVLLRAVQPVLWLVVFGEVFTSIRAIPTGDLRYLDYMAPGVLAQSVLFTSIFFGIALIWERDLGIVTKLMVTPTPRAALVLGKALGGGARSLMPALLVFVLSLLLGVKIDFHPLHLLGVLVFIVIGSALFSTFSLIIACLIRSRERFMGIAQLMTMPLFFASNAIYPVQIMPGWLKVLATLNPLTYEVDALRYLMLPGGTSAYGLGVDALVLLITAATLVTLGGRLYHRVVV